MNIVLLLLCVVFCFADDLLNEMKENVILTYGAYCQPSDLESWSCYWCDQSIKFEKHSVFHHSSNDLLFFVGKYENTLYLVYRGTPKPTKSIWDWIQDFNFCRVDTKYAPSGVEIHGGFWGMFETLHNETVSLVNEYLEEFPEITDMKILGHSLGCTFAHLAAFVLFVDGNKEFQSIANGHHLEIMTFASPRLGNADFVKYFNSKIPKENVYRVVNQRDIVTSLPPEAMGFRHLPTQYWFEDAPCCTYKTCDGSGEDPNCSDGVLMHSIMDHVTYLNISLFDATAPPFNCWG